MHKLKLLIIALAVVMTSSIQAENGIPVMLDPTSDAPQIGELATLSLAVPAKWPVGSEAQEGWQPVYYRGVFEVYVDNNDIGKDLTAKPGSLYYLAPDKNATKLAIATDKDKVDIISVDTWFCKMQLETIVVGYIQNASIDASSIVTNLPEPALSSDAAESTETAITELVGRLEKTGLLGRNRTGLAYKLSGNNGKTLAFVDTSEVPERIQVEDLLSLQVRVSGFLTQNEDGNTVILKAKTLKKAN